MCVSSGMPYAEAGAWGSALASSLARRPARSSAMPRLLHLLQAILLLATPGLVTVQVRRQRSCSLLAPAVRVLHNPCQPARQSPP